MVFINCHSDQDVALSLPWSLEHILITLAQKSLLVEMYYAFAYTLSPPPPTPDTPSLLFTQALSYCFFLRQFV